MRRRNDARQAALRSVAFGVGTACYCLACSAALAAHHRPVYPRTLHSKTIHVNKPASAAASTNKDPINIDAAKLDYFDKEQKLIYTGHVVAVRGNTTLKTPRLVVFLSPKKPGAPAGPPNPSSQVRRMVASGPVTIISKDQIATGDSGVYIKAENRIYLNGNVTLTQGPNVTKGDHLVYNTVTAQAVVTGHVRSLFIPNNDKKASDQAADKREPMTR